MNETQTYNTSLKRLKDLLGRARRSLSSQKAEIIILTYQRPHNLKSILHALSRQTYDHFRINILNNNVERRKEVDDIVGQFSHLDIQLRHANTNLGSRAKFTVAKNTKGNPLIFLDDDMIPHVDFVQYMVSVHSQYGKRYILGWHGYRFVNERFVGGKEVPSVGEEVDYVGSGSMVIDRSVVETIKELHHTPSYIQHMEDLWLSFQSQKYRYSLVKIERKIEQIVDGLDQYHDLKEEKNDVFVRLRSQGWKLVRERKRIRLHVLVTGYNIEEYVEACIESIKSQRYDNFSCVIIDDGSEDATYEVAKRVVGNDARFAIYKNERNRGAAYTRYKGFQLFDAQDHEVCMYVDGDDYLMHDRVFDRILDEYQDDTCWFTYGSPVGPFSYVSGPLPAELVTNKDFRRAPWVYGHPRTYRYILVRNLHKEDFLDQEGNFLETVTDAGFLYHMLEMAGKERIRHIPDVLYYYREHPRNSWKTYKNKGVYRDYIRSKKPYDTIPA